jgi:hypothetical protein
MMGHIWQCISLHVGIMKTSSEQLTMSIVNANTGEMNIWSNRYLHAKCLHVAIQWIAENHEVHTEMCSKGKSAHFYACNNVNNTRDCLDINTESTASLTTCQRILFVCSLLLRLPFTIRTDKCRLGFERAASS